MLYNPKGAEARVFLYALTSSEDNSGHYGRELLVAGKGTMRIGYSGRWWDDDAPWLGAILLSADGLLSGWAKIYTQTTTGGTCGQSVPLIPLEDAFGAYERGYIPGLPVEERFRTNFGVANLGPNPIEVTISVPSGDGSNLDYHHLKVPPFSHAQEPGLRYLHPDPGRPSVYAVVESISPGARYMAYASVVEGFTGDASFIPAQR